MWINKLINFLAVCLLVCNFQCSKENKTNRTNNNLCFYVSDDRHTHLLANLLKQKLKIKLDNVEEQGVSLFFEISSNNSNISFITFSDNNPFNYKINKFAKDAFSFGPVGSLVYFNIKRRDQSNELYINISGDASQLDKELIYGYEYLNKTSNLCLDRNFISEIYYGDKREIEAGPALDGADPEKLKKQWEEEQKKK